MITFLSAIPPSRRDAETWGLARLAGRGFDVALVDLGSILSFGAGSRDLDSAAVDGWAIARPEDITELVVLLGDRAAGVFIDFVAGLSDIGKREERIYRVLGDIRARLAVVYGGAVPALRPGMGRHLRDVGAFRRALAKASDPERVLGALARRRLQAARSRGETYPLPERIFSGRSEALESFVARYPSTADRVVPINSFDFDRYLEFVEAGPLPECDGTCLFIDEGLFFHPDWEYFALRPVEPETYRRDMDEFLHVLSERTGLRIRVAAHPRVPIERAREAFPGFEVVHGGTLEHVASASAVVTHASTAVSFAVLLDRPVLVADTQGMRASGYADRVEATAAALGLSVLHSSDPADIAAFDFSPHAWSRAGFQAYRDRYVADPRAPRRNTWDIVADSLAALGERQES